MKIPWVIDLIGGEAKILGRFHAPQLGLPWGVRAGGSAHPKVVEVTRPKFSDSDLLELAFRLKRSA